MDPDEASNANFDWPPLHECRVPIGPPAAAALLQAVTEAREEFAGAGGDARAVDWAKVKQAAAKLKEAMDVE